MGREVPVDLKQTVNKVKEADIFIFAGGISPAVEGEEMHVNIPGLKGGDRETIELQSNQSRLLAELKKAGKKISPLLNGGGQEAGFRSTTENVAGIAAMA